MTRVKPGDHVICSWNPHCGHCYYCEHGMPILCEPYTRHQPRGHLMDGTTRMSLDGMPVHHYFTTSTHAQYTVVPQAGAVPVSRDIPLDRASIIGCGVMTGIGAAVRKARVAAGSSVAVIGCGAVGLNVLQGARLAGAARIVGVDLDPRRRERALAFGATDVIDGGDGGVLDAIRGLTGGRGVDYAFEAAGTQASLRLSVEVARPGGDVVWLGKVDVEREVSFRWGSLMGEKRIVRSSYGDAHPSHDFPWIVDQYLEGRILLDPLITARIDLDAINQGFDALARGEGLRTVIVLDPGLLRP